ATAPSALSPLSLHDALPISALLPDPRSRKYVTHSAEALLTQHVYQLLAGYPDCDDANALRTDALFQLLADVAPDPDRPLASGSRSEEHTSELQSRSDLVCRL